MHPAAVFRVLVELAPYYLEPGDPSRAGRLEQVAGLLAPYPRSTIAALVELGQSESGFARYVGEGCYQVPPGAPSCDHGTSLGYWQVKRRTCSEAFQFPPWTVESLSHQVTCAARHFRWALWYCAGKHPSGRVAGAFAAYAGQPCDWEDGTERAERMLFILYKLNRLRYLSSEDFFQFNRFATVATSRE